MLIAIATTFILTSANIFFNCGQATLTLPYPQQHSVVYFTVNQTHYPAVFDEADNTSQSWTYSFPNDGDRLTGTQTLTGVALDGEFVPLQDPVTIECEQSSPNRVLLPIVIKGG